jgi:flagellar biosynthesis protein FlhF
LEEPEPGAAAPEAWTDHRSIDLSADEDIDLPPAEQPREPASGTIDADISEAARAVGDILNAHAATEKQDEITDSRHSRSRREDPEDSWRGREHEEGKHNSREAEKIEERLENLQQFLEKKLTEDAVMADKNTVEGGSDDPESVRMFRMLYETLLDNEVDEIYINQLLEDVMKVSRKGSSMDFILSHMYQKLVLKFGNPKALTTEGDGPTVAFFIGPTGVGKTTTIAKLASKFKVDQDKKVAFLTADTYRISATEQLRTYANILEAPLSVIYTPEELLDAVEKLSDYDLIFVDTAGLSHKNEAQQEDIRKLISSLNDHYNYAVYLVLSATTKYRDLKKICDTYRKLADYSIIFTKLDETGAYGNLLNIKLYSGADVSYTSGGQNVPDDISLFQSQEIVKKLLGGD